MPEPIVLLENLSYQYPGAPAPVLRDINLRVERGEFVGILGPTGAGKTTLCLALNGIVPQFYGGRFFGRARVAGLDTLERPIQDLARHVGMVFQDPEAQLLTTSVENEVAFALENLCVAPDTIRARVARALAAVRLTGLERKRPYELSGGQKQRLAIAAALAVEPDLLVLDEPTTQLDPVGQQEVFETVARLNRERGVTVVMVSHAVEYLAEHAHRIVVLDQGQVVRVGRPGEVFGEVAWLEALGLRVPQVTRFFHLMAARGERVDPLPVSEGEARSVYRARRDRWRVRVGSAEGGAPRREGAPLIEVRNLRHVYPDGTEALRGVSLQVWPGEYVVVVGQNGAGKSTLAKHLVHLLEPTSGTVRVAGQDVRGLSTGALAQKVGFISQNPDSQIFTTSVEEEVAFALRARKMPEAEVEQRVTWALREMGLWQHRNRHPLSLPKGDRARLVVAAVLAMGPEIFIFDEPTTGQDYQGARRILELSRHLREQGKTVLVITHHLYLMPSYAERAVVMGKGDILLDAPLRQAFHAVEVLRCSYLQPPQIVNFARAIAALEGVALPVLTEEELADHIEIVAEGAHGGV
ncbi:MAG: ATP-binding cassette domain-containing protein [Anaerolineae bacterium]|nr:ATP-binding cassette domain-containing protein [Anaerolineae bacterium]